MNSFVKNLVLVAVLAAGAYFGFMHESTQATTSAQTGTGATQESLGPQASSQQVRGSGVVDKILADDNQGSRHQRFILRLASGQTLLIAHNIDLAPRLANLRTGDKVEYNGEFEWNDRGGVVHWTHRDPANHHEAGWLKHDGQTFQ